MSVSDVEKTAVAEIDNVDVKASRHETYADLPPMDPVALRKLRLKCDLYVVPPLFVLFLLAFLDRTNIGNAKIQGLEDGLNLSGPQYNIALFIFFVPYILFEVPSNVLLKKIAPSTWLSSIMFFWGQHIRRLYISTPSDITRDCDDGPRTCQRLWWTRWDEVRTRTF